MQAELRILQHGSSTPGGPQGLTQLAQAAADAREKRPESARSRSRSASPPGCPARRPQSSARPEQDRPRPVHDAGPLPHGPQTPPQGRRGSARRATESGRPDRQQETDGPCPPWTRLEEHQVRRTARGSPRNCENSTTGATAPSPRRTAPGRSTWSSGPCGHGSTGTAPTTTAERRRSAKTELSSRRRWRPPSINPQTYS